MYHEIISGRFPLTFGQRIDLPRRGDWIDKGLSLALAGLLVLGLAFRDAKAQGPPGPGAMPPPVVEVAPVAVEDVNPPTEYVGHVEAIQQVDLRARVEGFLEHVNFKEGQFVRTGDVLYAIEHAPYEAKVDADKARVAEAEAKLTYATQRLKRLRAARPESVPGTDMDNAVAAGLQAKAQLAEAKANLTRSELDLSYTTIKAPISGRIGRTAYTQGNLVGPTSKPLARIVQIDPIRVVYSVSESELETIQTAWGDSSRQTGAPILLPTIRLPNGRVYRHSGQVDFINNEVDAATGTLAVWASFSNPDGVLLPGLYVTVLVKKSKPRMLPVVPQSSVLQDREGPYVLVVDQQKRVGIRRIQTGPTIGPKWAVESGLKKGDTIIVRGLLKVRPGMVVKAIPQAAGREK